VDAHHVISFGLLISVFGATMVAIGAGRFLRDPSGATSTRHLEPSLGPCEYAADDWVWGAAGRSAMETIATNLSLLSFGDGDQARREELARWN
jgi:hypothetical protein